MDLTLFSDLPDDVLYKICCLTGKFRLIYDEKFKKKRLINIFNFTDKIWVDFNYKFSLCFNKKIRRCTEVYIDSMGNLRSRKYIKTYILPTILYRRLVLLEN